MSEFSTGVLIFVASCVTVSYLSRIYYKTKKGGD